MKTFLFSMGVCVSMVLSAQQAVLYTGSDWSRADAPFVSVWQNPEFIASAGVTLATVDLPQKVTDEVRATWEKQKAIRWEMRAVPAFAYFDAKGRCVLLRQGLQVADDASVVAYLTDLVEEGKARAEKIEALLAPRTAQGAGRALEIMLPELGHRWSRDPHGLKEAWEILEEKDKEDKRGWKFAHSFEPMDVCYKVLDARKKSDAEAEALIQSYEANPQTALSLNQKQGLKLLRAVPLKNTPEENALLKEVVAMGEDTLFGAAAKGILCYRGEGDISVPHGWFPKDVTRDDRPDWARQFAWAMDDVPVWKIRTGVPLKTRLPGHYELVLKREKGAGDMQIKWLIVGGRSYGEASTLAVGDTLTIPFEVKEEDNRELHLGVLFDAPEGERGSIAIRPALAERTGTVTPWTWKTSSAVAKYAHVVIPKETFEEIGNLPGGGTFLESFSSDTPWMEDFFASGKPMKDWETSFRALDALVYYCRPKNAFEKRWATAAALNVGDNLPEMIRLYQAMMTNAKKDLLAPEAESLRTDLVRYVLLPNQLSAEDALWLADEHRTPSPSYTGTCWYAPYRLDNFFGNSVHGNDYHRWWDHFYTRHEKARHVGAVCGGLSYYGSAAAKARGIPSTPAGQPYHCAYAVWLNDEQRWELAYNVNPYSWTHFDAWEGAYSYSLLDLQAEAFATRDYRVSMRAFWAAEALRAQRYPSPTRTKTSCQAYAWNKRVLPKSFDDLESLGSWEEVDSFDVGQARPEHVCLVWKGAYEVPKKTKVRVSVYSDDGARLWLDGQEVAGKDGLHGMEGTTTDLTLTRGSHPFELHYFNLNGGRSLEVKVEPLMPLDRELDAAYRKALSLCPLNYPLWRAYAAWLRQCEEVNLETWNTFGDQLAKGMANHIEPAWTLLQATALPEIKRLGGKDALKAALVRWSGVIAQGPQPTAEFCDYIKVLDQLAKTVDDDPEACFAFFTAALPAQFGTRDAFGRLMKWGASRFLADEAMAKRYVAALNNLLKAKGNEGNALGQYVRESIREAGVAGNLEAFHALCDLQDALNPKERKPLDFGAFTTQPLLSKDGYLTTSSTSRWDHPEVYRYVLDDKEPVDNFHTGNDQGAWAEVVLPGMAEVSAVYLNNDFGQNSSRLVPFVVEVSEDGKTWVEVAKQEKVEALYRLTFPAVKAQRVRVKVCPEDGSSRLLHLRKFAVFGKKLY